ncbi:hypothetical protein BU24DRAFT_451724 [Aaosphaeria arxii CBS 175.79]|uniref:BRCT domain-containing protein n=1 Tax=Aaosphaeria arxii CBS 175.79 TaxID=1450172 RepID=A0A6A5XNC6_9PLEO|nr:uncharacterized protein BU24DRAFT_451724 [Aaosphaeria arxii CBS 175.79]KAF2014775.1 hypothetical protein BU24DRAFT_451724 [Aaosphaeria arxii CBS 175.79]
MGCLKNLVITVAGNVGHRPEQLKKWVEANDGRWVPRVTKDTTHVICSKDEWKKATENVAMAQRFGVRIVSYDWLEDSLQRGRKLGEKKYLWTAISKQRKKQKQMKRLGKMNDTRQFKQGVQKAYDDTGSGTSSRFVPCTQRSGFFVSSLAELQAKREQREQHKDEQVQNPEPVVNKEGEKDDDGLEKDQQNPTLESTSSTPPPNTPSKSTITARTPSSTIKSSPSPSIPRQDLESTPPKPPHSPTSPPATTALDRDNANTIPPSPPSPVPPTNPNSLKDNYHIYVDPTSFPYDITLTRPNLFRNLHAHYTLRLFESNTKPHTYTTVARYRPPTTDAWPSANNLINTPGIPGITYPPPSPPSPTTSTTPQAPFLHTIPQTPTPHLWKKALCPLNTPHEHAFRAFRTAFHTLTLLRWEERVSPAVEALQHARARVLNLEPFFYRRPAPPASCGLLPAVEIPGEAYVRAEVGEEEGGLGLRGMEVMLNREGICGRRVVMEVEARRRREVEEAEEEERKRKERKERERGKAGVRKGRSVRESFFFYDH